MAHLQSERPKSVGSPSFATVRFGARRFLTQIAVEIRGNRRLLLLDIIALSISAAIAVLLIVADGSRTSSLSELGFLPLLALVCGALMFPLSGIYRRDARSFSLRDVLAVVRGTAAAILLTALASAMPGGDPVPSVPVFVVQFLIAVPVLCSLRIVARRDELVRRGPAVDHDTRLPVLVVGTGATCDLFLRSLRQPGARYRAIGIVDDARGKEHLYFHDVRILGSVRDPGRVIAAIQAAEQPRRIFLTAPVTNFDSDGIEKLLGWAARQGISVLRLPELGDPEAGASDGRAPALRTVDPDDILHRPQKVVQRSLLRGMIEGRRVLVTGAGGSIGSELARQIASFGPERLVLIDSCEYNAYAIEMDLAREFPDVDAQVCVASIRDVVRMGDIFRAHMPELVFNAAALKHVPMVERDPCEGVLTNVVGARNVADAARAVGAIAMVQISTDKAVNSTNVMGATKRVAEFYCQAQDRITLQTEERTRFFVVRFGNVLGSSGSLIPLFQRQIAAGGPLTVTDPRMERYFMTIREAVELTLLAAAEGLKRRSALGEILVLDMGRPVKIMDLARRMIRLAGLRPDEDIRIEIIGRRPGEKLFEELFDAEEEVREGLVPGLRAAVPRGVPIARLRAAILRLERHAQAGDEDAVRRGLAELVPGYAAGDAEDDPRPPRGQTLPFAAAVPTATRAAGARA